MAQTDEAFSYCKELLGHQITIKEASEPTDIIWENRSVSYSYKLFKKVVVAATVLLLLSLSLTIVFACQKTSITMMKMYPDYECSDTIKEHQKNP